MYYNVLQIGIPSSFVIVHRNHRLKPDSPQPVRTSAYSEPLPPLRSSHFISEITDFPFENEATALCAAHPFNDGPFNFSLFSIFIFGITRWFSWPPPGMRGGGGGGMVNGKGEEWLGLRQQDRYQKAASHLALILCPPIHIQSGGGGWY